MGWIEDGRPSNPLKAVAWNSATRKKRSKCFPAGAYQAAMDWWRAEEAAMDRRAVEHGTEVKRNAGKVMTLGSFGPMWLATTHGALETQAKRRESLRWLIGYFGESKPITEITKAEVRAMVASIAGGTGPTLAQSRLTVLRGLMRLAVEDGLREADLTAGISAPQQPKQRESLILTDEQAEAIITHLPGPSKLAVRIGLDAGLRVSEAAALPASCVNPLKRTITVKYMVQADGSIRPHPKSKRPRTVPMPKRLAAAVTAHLAEHGTAVTGELISHETTGERLRRDTLLEQFAKARDAAGVAAIFHDLRHTCATRYGDSGAQAPMIQKILGHQLLSTSQRYVRDPGAEAQDAWASAVFDGDDVALRETGYYRLQVAPRQDDGLADGEQQTG